MHHRRQPEVVDRRDLVRDQPEGRPQRGPLEVGVDAEACAPGDAVREVELPVGLQPLPLVVGENRVDDLARVGRCERRIALELDQAAAHSDGWGRSGGEVQVGRAPIQNLEQQVGKVEIHRGHAHRQGDGIPFRSVQSTWTHRSKRSARSRSPRQMAVPSKQPLAIRILLGIGAVLLAAFALHAVLPLGADALFTDGVYNAVLILASALTLARGIAVRAERVPWLLIGTAMTLWTAGDIYFAAALESLDPVPIPSVADGFYLAFYPLAYAGLVLLVRARVQRFHRSLWLDGLIAALAVAALSAAVVVHAVSTSLGDAPTAEVAVNMAYPLGDLGLLALVAAILAMTGWKPGRTWALLAVGLLAFGVSDSLYLFQSATDAYSEGTLVDVGWPAALLIVAVAAWQPPARHPRLTLEGWRVMVAPAAFGTLCLGLLVWGTSQRLDWLALVFATAGLLIVIARMALTYGENLRMLAASRVDAKTDPLTRLGNRRALMVGLDRALEDAADGRRHALALLDLNGFKAYNDTFGHPAGDA